MICCSVLLGVCARLKHCLFPLGLLLCMHAAGQTTDADPLVQARAAIAKQEWSKAEAIIQPIVQSQPKNPFAIYELAQVYENTNRIEGAKQLYLDLTGNPEFVQRQPTLVIRAPYASKMVYILSLAQARLNAIAVKQLNAMPPPPPAPAPVQAKQTPAPLPVVVIPNSVTTAVAPPAPPPATRVIQPQTQETDVPTGVSTSLKTWAEAWSRKDLALYFACYVENYRGDQISHEAWKKQRQTNISRAEKIQIELKNIEMTTLPPYTAKVTFVQIYKSNLLQSTTRKTLNFVAKEGHWLIESETAK